jgi:hypothetical protein
MAEAMTPDPSTLTFVTFFLLLGVLGTIPGEGTT